jgi:hypothetical protein
VNEPLGAVFAFLMCLALAVGVFLLFRTVVLWYWKVDKIVEHLGNIEALLKQPRI